MILSSQGNGTEGGSLLIKYRRRFDEVRWHSFPQYHKYSNERLFHWEMMIIRLSLKHSDSRVEKGKVSDKPVFAALSEHQIGFILIVFMA